MSEQLLTFSLLNNKYNQSNTIDNNVDKLTRLYSVWFMLILIIMVTSKLYIATPIDCWCPSQFTESQVSFTNSYCWVSTNYFLKSEKSIVPYNLQETPKLQYYPWTPLILIIFCFISLLPSFVWHLLLNNSGLNIFYLFQICHQLSVTSVSPEDKKNHLNNFVELFDRFTSSQRSFSNNCFQRNLKFVARKCFIFGGKAHGNYFCNTYLFYKLLNTITPMFQMTLMDFFLGEREFLSFGLRVIHSLLEGLPLSKSHHFPVKTICEMSIRQQSRLHSYVVECVLTANVFYEKIFMCLWFWLAFNWLVTMFDFLKWLVMPICWRKSILFISKRLVGSEMRMERVLLAGFVKRYLRRDGVLIMRLISCNHGDILVGYLLEELWKIYLPNKKKESEEDALRRRKRRMVRDMEVIANEFKSNSATNLL